MIDINDLMKYWTLDKKSRKKMIESNPTLSKYSDQLLKRKPKRLDSELAKKLENPEHRLTGQYFSLKDIEKIEDIKEFDELRKNSYIIQYNRIIKVKDPSEQSYQLSRLYGQIKEDIQYFIGQQMGGEGLKDLPLEEQIERSKIIGAGQFKK